MINITFLWLLRLVRRACGGGRRAKEDRVEAEDLREQSALCRRLAEGLIDKETADRLLELACRYEREVREASGSKPNGN